MPQHFFMCDMDRFGFGSVALCRTRPRATLEAGVDCLVEVPLDRWDVDAWWAQAAVWRFGGGSSRLGFVRRFTHIPNIVSLNNFFIIISSRIKCRLEFVFRFTHSHIPNIVSLKPFFLVLPIIPIEIYWLSFTFTLHLYKMHPIEIPMVVRVAANTTRGSSSVWRFGVELNFLVCQF